MYSSISHQCTSSHDIVPSQGRSFQISFSKMTQKVCISVSHCRWSVSFKSYSMMQSLCTIPSHIYTINQFYIVGTWNCTKFYYNFLVLFWPTPCRTLQLIYLNGTQPVYNKFTIQLSRSAHDHHQIYYDLFRARKRSTFPFTQSSISNCIDISQSSLLHLAYIRTLFECKTFGAKIHGLLIVAIPWAISRSRQGVLYVSSQKQSDENERLNL